jgi:hypothetical protein
MQAEAGAGKKEPKSFRMLLAWLFLLLKGMRCPCLRWRLSRRRAVGVDRNACSCWCSYNCRPTI